MRDISPFNFGLLIAYLVPGFIVLWGAGYHFPIVRTWLAESPDNAPQIGDLLYATLGAIACGMTVSVFRWAIIDTFHHHTGIKPPIWNFSILHERLDAYQALIEIHYRYYQAHANMFLAILFTYAARFFAIGFRTYQMGAMDIGFLIVSIVLFFGSRNALKKYYLRAGELLKPN